ncbi:MAG: ABC transporter ATP-binding protein [Candidatus Bathyarchaeia archaeon]
MVEIRLESVSKRFGRTQALKNVSFHVRDKEFFSLLGPPGSGKTTLLRIIAGLEKPDEGNVYLDGEVVNEFPPRERDISMLFENLAVYPNKTGFENIAFALRIKKTPESEVKGRVEEVAKLLRIQHLLDREPRTFSGGEIQRVALAGTMVRRSKAMLLDEPLSNLDALLRLNMRAELKHLQRDIGRTVVYATHDQAEATTMSDRICAMHRGEVDQVGTPDELYHKPRTLFVANLIGSVPMNFIDCTLEDKGPSKTVLNEGVFQVDVSKYRDIINEKAVGRELVLGVRPEDITIHNEPQAKDAVEAKVVVTEPLGDRVVVNVRAGKEKMIKVIGSPDERYEIGDRKWLQFNWDEIHIIDKKTEEVII